MHLERYFVRAEVAFHDKNAPLFSGNGCLDTEAQLL